MRAIILFVAEKLINNRYTKINTGSYFKRLHIKQKKKMGFSCNLPSIIKFEAKSLISLPKIRITEIILKQFKLGLKTCHESHLGDSPFVTAHIVVTVTACTCPLSLAFDWLNCFG